MVEAVLRESLNVSVSTFGLRPHPDAASAHLIPCGGVLRLFMQVRTRLDRLWRLII